MVLYTIVYTWNSELWFVTIFVDSCNLLLVAVNFINMTWRVAWTSVRQQRDYCVENVRSTSLLSLHHIVALNYLHQYWNNFDRACSPVPAPHLSPQFVSLTSMGATSVEHAVLSLHHIIALTHSHSPVLEQLR